jgi:predicted acylesterase/phospholipase RssA
VRAALQDDATGAFFLPRPSGAVRKPLPCSARISTGLFEQTRRFDAVIVDGGSLSDGPLAYMLAEMADDIVLVASGQADMAAAERLYRRALGPDAEKVRAVVFNPAAG